jgi:hypothetical protein
VRIAELVAGPTMIFDADREPGTGATFVSLVGQMSLATVPDVRTSLHDLAAECPTALILDVGDTTPVRSNLLTALATSAQRAAAEYGVPVLVCASAEGVPAHLDGDHSIIPVYPSREAAIAAVRAAGLRWARLHLEPAMTAAADARRLVEDACAAWGVDHLGDVARLVVSELVNNVVLHAGTGCDVTVALNDTLLRIGVQDGSSAEPRLVLDSLLAPALARHGWGLRIVQECATRWGCSRIDGDGKIVWAHLALDAGLRSPTRFTHEG